MPALTLPAWADVLIVLALPVILGIALLIWGKDEPDNAITHHQEPGGDDEPDVLAEVA